MTTPTQQDATQPGQDATETPYARNARRLMETEPTERTWRIPAHHDKEPITMTLRLPGITITDSEGALHRADAQPVVAPRGPVGQHLRLVHPG